MKDFLSIRMRMNASLVPEGARVADIGCDHGYVAIWLVKEKKCPHVIATDVNEGPIRRAQKNISDAREDDRIEIKLGDGLSVIDPDDVDVILIAGMGGMRICEILSAGMDVIKDKTLILQPQSDIEEVRRHLHKVGFRIDRESICLDDGKYYFAIRAVPGQEERPYSDTEYRYSRLLSEEGGTVYRSYIRDMINKVGDILESLKNVEAVVDSDGRLAKRREELEQMLLIFKEHAR
ncbi:MAG: SAM-dependent methyltransferase [Eubacterium sp.]|nr:SAM-dependent methyltransferase [Eubacterium sp.]